MNRKKILEMICNTCHVTVGDQPIIILQRDGGSHLEQQRAKKCPYCGAGLQRHVTKVKA